MAVNGEKKMDFRPVTFDPTNIQPDAPEGEWRAATIPRGKIQVKATKAKDNGGGNYPMLIIPVKLGGAEDEKNENHNGAEVSTLFVFYPEDSADNARAARMAKLNLRNMCEALDVDLSEVLPAELTCKEDFDPLIRALEGKTFTCWTKHRVNKETGETQVDTYFKQPGGGLLAGASKKNDDEDEDERPVKKGAKGPSSSSKNGSSKNGRR